MKIRLASAIALLAAVTATSAEAGYRSRDAERVVLGAVVNDALEVVSSRQRMVTDVGGYRVSVTPIETRFIGGIVCRSFVYEVAVLGERRRLRTGGGVACRDQYAPVWTEQRAGFPDARNVHRRGSVVPRAEYDGYGSDPTLSCRYSRSTTRRTETPRLDRILRNRRGELDRREVMRAIQGVILPQKRTYESERCNQRYQTYGRSGTMHGEPVLR